MESVDVDQEVEEIRVPHAISRKACPTSLMSAGRFLGVDGGVTLETGGGTGWFTG